MIGLVLDDFHHRFAGAVTGAGLHTNEDRSETRLRHLQGGGDLKLVAAKDAVVVVGGCNEGKKISFSVAANLAYHARSESCMDSALLKSWFGALISAVVMSTACADMFPASGPIVSGSVARLRFGRAAAPSRAPLAVKRAIWAANQLATKPYRFGGGHRSFHDRAYDCSGTVSYALGGAGLIKSPMNSSDFRSYGARGRGKWITIYARPGHTYAVIAGLRLDTTPWDRYTGRWAPRWQSSDRVPLKFEARHPIGL